MLKVAIIIKRVCDATQVGSSKPQDERKFIYQQGFFRRLASGHADYQNADYVVCVPHPYLFQAQAILKGSSIAWGGQNMSRYESGAYTGSVSPGMLTEFGCEYVIIGHSERRQRGHDTDLSTGERFLAATKVG